MNVICASQCCHSPPLAATLARSSRSHATDSAVLCRSASSSKRSSSPTQTVSSSFFGPRGGARGGLSSSSSSAASDLRAERKRTVVSAGLWDFWGGDLLGFDLDRWCKDVEDYGSIAVYPPHEGGYEGRYVTRLKQAGYHFMNISARGLGDPEACLTKVHGVRPAHLGKQAIECFYFPPEVDYRLSALPENSKGLVLWVIEAKVLSKTELQYLALLPAMRRKVKVIAECGNWRSYRWKPLRVAAGLPLIETRDLTKSEEPKLTETADAGAETSTLAETAEEPTGTATTSEVEKEPPVKVSV